jgi:hypothetical protein
MLTSGPFAKGTAIQAPDGVIFKLNSPVLEGHRFCYKKILKGEELLSWGLRFGIALCDIEPGQV